MKDLWRVDIYTEEVCFVEGVDDGAPVGEWLMPLWGDGMYRYERDEVAARSALREALKAESSRILGKIEEI